MLQPMQKIILCNRDSKIGSEIEYRISDRTSFLSCAALIVRESLKYPVKRNFNKLSTWDLRSQLWSHQGSENDPKDILECKDHTAPCREVWEDALHDVVWWESLRPNLKNSLDTQLIFNDVFMCCVFQLLYSPVSLKL